MLEQVRSFNRVVTQSIGALHDHYLSRSLPLGAARVLWEIGEGCDVRELRVRLALDSGYLSRLLRQLEGSGLVTVEPNPDDRRVRSVRLTAAGRRERDGMSHAPRATSCRASDRRAGRRPSRRS